MLGNMLCLETLCGKSSCRSKAPIKQDGLAWGQQIHYVKRAIATETETRDNTALGGREEVYQAMWTYEGWDETRMEVSTMMADLLTPKHETQQRMREGEDDMSDRIISTRSPRNAPRQNQFSGCI